MLSGEQDVLPPARGPSKSCVKAAPSALLTVHQAQRVLQSHLRVRIPRATLYRWCSNGTILTTRIAHRLFVITTALASFLALRTERAAADFGDLPPDLREQAEEHNRAIFEAIQLGDPELFGGRPEGPA